MISFIKSKYSLVALMVAFCMVSFSNAKAQHGGHTDTSVHEQALTSEPGHEGTAHAGGHEEKKGFDAKEVILGHVKDAHDWHFFSIDDFHATVPLPVIIYHPERGFTTFMSSKFEHGHAAYEGYRLLTDHYIAENHLDPAVYSAGKIIEVDANDQPTGAKIQDWSITKNITALLIATILLLVLMIGVANTYKTRGVKSAPKGFQGLVEPVIIFIRDEVVKPNIPGYRAERFTPFILTVFFFILINNLFGLLPGSANVTGNIAVTAALALFSFIATCWASNRHYWGHIVNPPVPAWVKPILAPVELIGVFTKPISLMIRLFANILAGHIIILSIVSLIFIFGSLNKVAGYGFMPISIAFNLVMMMLELLVAFIQAFIFANLTAVFVGQAMEGAHHDEHHH